MPNFPVAQFFIAVFSVAFFSVAVFKAAVFAVNRETPSFGFLPVSFDFLDMIPVIGRVLRARDVVMNSTA